MTIIGVVRDSREKGSINKNVILKRINKSLNSKKELLIYIEQKNIKNIKNIKFNMIFILVKQFDKKNFEAYKKIIENSKCVVVNIELFRDKEFIELVDNNFEK